MGVPISVLTERGERRVPILKLKLAESFKVAYITHLCVSEGESCVGGAVWVDWHCCVTWVLDPGSTGLGSFRDSGTLSLTSSVAQVHVTQCHGRTVLGALGLPVSSLVIQDNTCPFLPADSPTRLPE